MLKKSSKTVKVRQTFKCFGWFVNHLLNPICPSCFDMTIWPKQGGLLSGYLPKMQFLKLSIFGWKYFIGLLLTIPGNNGNLFCWHNKCQESQKLFFHSFHLLFKLEMQSMEVNMWFLCTLIDYPDLFPMLCKICMSLRANFYTLKSNVRI